MKQTFLVLSTLAILAACGGSGTPTTEDPATRSASNFDADVILPSLQNTIVVDYSAATDQFTFAADGTALPGLIRTETQDNGMILGFRDSPNEMIGFVYQSDDGLASVIGGHGDKLVFRGATIERFGEAEVPVTGAATFTGDYAGIVATRVGARDELHFLANGDATLTADFADNTVDGRITNRSLRRENNELVPPTIADITLNATTLDDNIRFSGFATGGGIDGRSTSNGAYIGSINGDAAEALGIVTLEHEGFGGPSITEWGIFALTD